MFERVKRSAENTLPEERPPCMHTVIAPAKLNLVLPFGKGRGAKKVREIVTEAARHAYDYRTLFVPGFPEADTDDAASATYRYLREVVRCG